MTMKNDHRPAGVVYFKMGFTLEELYNGNYLLKILTIKNEGASLLIHLLIFT